MSDAKKEAAWDAEFIDSLECIRRASRDARLVIFALLTFTLAIVIVHLNSLPSGWTKRRIAIVREALAADCADSIDDKAPKTDWKSEYAKNRTFLNCEELYGHFQALKTVYREEILTLNVPVVGIRIDANWAAVLSSAGFLLLLAAVLATMEREQRALSLNESEELLRRARAANLFPRWLAMLVIWVPILIVWWAYYHDLRTMILGRSIDRTLSLATNTIGLILAVACVLVALRAARVLLTLDARRRGIRR